MNKQFIGIMDELLAAASERNEVPNLLEMRRKMGMTKCRFAELLDVTSRTIYKWEKGISEPSGPARMMLLILSELDDMVSDGRICLRVLTETEHRDVIENRIGERLDGCRRHTKRVEREAQGRGWHAP